MSPFVLIMTAAILAEPPAAPGADVKPAAAATPAAPLVRPSSGPVRRVDANADAGPLRDDLEIVEAGTEDVGALGKSLRQPAHDSRLPSAFLRVYRVPGEEGKLMRGNGALFAVFPESVYRRSGRGQVPLAPPGTVFHIGMPGELHLAPEAPHERALAPGQVDGRVATRAEPAGSLGMRRIDGRVDGRVSSSGSAGPAPSRGTTQQPPSNAKPASPAPTPSVDAVPLGPQDPYAHLGFGPPRVERD